MSLKTGQQQHSLPKSANSTVFQSARDAWISKYKACMKMVNMINDKLSEGLTARTVCKNSGIQVPLLHPQSFQQIHAEKPHMPTWEYKNLSSSLVNNCWRCRPANLFCFLSAKDVGTCTEFIEVKAKTHWNRWRPKACIHNVWKERVTELEQPY